MEPNVLDLFDCNIRGIIMQTTT